MKIIQKVEDGRTDLILDLLKLDNVFEILSNHGDRLIKYAAYYGDVTAVRILVARGIDLTMLGPNYDLNGAAFHGHWQLCQYLLEQGANANYPLSESGETPLHSCLSKINSWTTRHIVELLLHYGADPNASTIPGRETGAFMRDARTYGETPLHRAAAFASESEIKMLINAGADKTSEDINGDTALSWASWHARPGSILALLSYGSHHIHPLHVKRMKSDHGFGYGGGIMGGLNGTLHMEEP